MQLNDLIENQFRLQESQRKAIKKLGLKTIKDLLYHFPVRYGDTSEIQTIETLKKGNLAVIFGKIKNLKIEKAFRSKISMAKGMIEDDTGSIPIVWFNQPYLAKMIAEGSIVRAEGKVSERKNGELYFSNPKIETVSKIPIGVGDSLFGEEKEAHTLYPIYPESRGITSNWMYYALQKIFQDKTLDNLFDPIPKSILDTYHLPALKSALIWIHTPQKRDHALSARKRFAFEEVFFIQLQKQKEKIDYQKKRAHEIEKNVNDIQDFISRFPFQPTKGQIRAIETILNDFKRGTAMSRLLEGDVGSGKTAVAAATAYAVISSKPKGVNYGRLQVAYMVPTEILASQHFESFIGYFRHMNVNIAVITGSGIKKFPSKVDPAGWTSISRPQLLKWIENGEIPIVIGTHALIQKTVSFKHLAYAIIDEQHRFGTKQRQKLVRKDSIAPHLLSMTATPIPRTLALTVFGDLDLTLLDEMPLGRKPIKTDIVFPNKREDMYEKIRRELKRGKQAYVICPRIDEPDPDKEKAIQAKSVKEEAQRLKKDIFPEYEIAILHSKMRPQEKEDVMNDFKNKEIDILCATSVVEVGVNVPNATMILIEGAERFGLAQLHQLRGRVIRSNDQAYCFVYAETTTKKVAERLKALKSAKNGFELAEFDLKQRGSGELYGGKQWGLSDVAMEALQNLKMVEAARAEAKNILEKDFELRDFLKTREFLKKSEEEKIHFE